MMILRWNGIIIIDGLPSGYDQQFALENPPIFKFGKASISIRAIFHGELLNNQRVYGIIIIIIPR